jgi:hypothetical protein
MVFSGKGKTMPQRSIEQVLKDNTGKWLAIPGVEGIAISLFEGKHCIRIFTSSNQQQLRAQIPSNIEGHPIIIEETGEFHALEQ